MESELDKMKKAHKESQSIGEFLEWMMEYHEDLFPDFLNVEEILAEYFDIDLEKVEKEKRALIHNLPKQLNEEEN